MRWLLLLCHNRRRLFFRGFVSSVFNLVIVSSLVASSSDVEALTPSSPPPGLGLLPRVVVGSILHIGTGRRGLSGAEAAEEALKFPNVFACMKFEIKYCFPPVSLPTPS